MPEWVRGFVERHMAAQAAESAEMRRLVDAAGGMRLFGTIGAEVFLRPDGTTRSLVEGTAREPARWVEDSDQDRIAALVIGQKRYPELARLLPPRPPEASDCPTCADAGRLHGFPCGACSGMGWRRLAAT